MPPGSTGATPWNTPVKRRDTRGHIVREAVGAVTKSRTLTGPSTSAPLATGTWVRTPPISKITPVPKPFCVATVDTTWKTAISVSAPVISAKALLKFTVTVVPTVVTESTSTELGMAVVIPATASELVGPTTRDLITEDRGAGEGINRCTASIC